MKRLRRNQINWNQVFYFSEIARAGSIKEAAAQLDLSPSTLSEHISQLEKDLAVQLFHRKHRKLALTEEGNRLFLRSKEMFEAGQRLIDVVSPIPLGSYPVSVGLVPSPSIPIAYKLLGDLLKKYRQLSMKLFHSRYAELETRLSEGKLDYGFTDRPPERRDLRSRVIASSVVRFYISPRLAETRFSDLLSSIPLLVCNAEPETRSYAEQALLDADLAPSSVVTADYPSALLELCERGLGVGVFSEASLAGSSFDHLRTLRVPRDAPKLTSQLLAVWANAAENTEAVRRLNEVLDSSR